MDQLFNKRNNQLIKIKISLIKTQKDYDFILEKLNKKIFTNCKTYITTKKKLNHLTDFNSCPACKYFELNQEAHTIGLGYCLSLETETKIDKYESIISESSRRVNKYINLKKMMINSSFIPKHLRNNTKVTKKIRIKDFFHYNNNNNR